MKLIKINTDHYIIVDDSEIKEGDWLYSFDNGLIVQANKGSADTINSKSLNGRGYGKITHSTQPLNTIILKNRNHSQSVGHYYGDGGQLSLQEVKELIGEVDVEKKADKMFPNPYFVMEGLDITPAYKEGYVVGYLQALEDNKDKKYTEKNIIKAIEMAQETALSDLRYEDREHKYDKYEIIQSIQPKTEWNVEFVDLEDLRSEYESTYLHYWNKDNPLLSFKQWLKKEKGIVFVSKDKLLKKLKL